MNSCVSAPLRLVAAMAALVITTLAAPDAAAQSGLQISPDGQRTLISKDLGSQRWAITLNADDGTVTGNVFAADGGRPSFVWCAETSRDGGDITFACSGADPCPLAPCPAEDEWTFIAEASLPTSFFQPRPGTPASASAVTAPPRGRVQGGVTQRASGVQPSLDGKRILISKDVGGQRWVIVWNEGDGTLTGNVFFPGGGDPQFVWCLQRGRDGQQIQFTCHGADRCAAPPCTRDAWSKIADVVLPVSFLEPSSQIASSDLARTVVDTFGSEDAGFRAVLLASDRGYSMRQIARAALSGRLGADGAIRARSGGTEAPDNTPTNLLAAATNASSDLAAPAQDSELIQALCDSFRDSVPPDQKLEILTRLLARGYSAAQIIQVVRGNASLQLCDGAPTPAEFRDCVDGNRGRSIGLIGPGGPIDPGESTEEVLIEPAPPGDCNRNGMWEPGEECDGSDLNGQTCTSLRLSEFIGGGLRCDSDCRLDTSGCRTRSVCGDGARDLDEDCDGTDLGGATCENVAALFPGGPEFTGGVLGCTNNPEGPCTYVYDGCLHEAQCGNGRVENGEDCDIGQLRGATCTNLASFRGPGQNVPEFIGGEIGCNTAPGQNCDFDLSECRRAGQSVCGDGAKDAGEECDLGQFGDRTCVTEGFAGGDLECDIPSDGSACRISIDSCRRDVDSRCGDGVRDQGEVCDAGDLGGETCVTQGFVSGDLDCFIPLDPTQPCRLVTDACRDRAECNNGVAEGDVRDEECDVRDFRGETCASLGIGDPRGTLECNPSNCTIDRDASCKQAQTCLNDVAEGTEDCDRQDLRGQSCEDQGFDFGTLACGNDCAFDVSGCERGCGQGDRTCPDGSCVPAGADCCGNGMFCQVGSVCAGGGCCPDTLPDACGANSCIPAGADCCDSGGGFCSPGTLCTGTGGCCPAEFPQPCGSSCIRAGAVCCNGNACAPGGSCCGGTCIGPGQQCCGGTNACGSGGTCCGSACVPAGSDCCQPNIACSPGMVCTNIAGVCCPTNAPVPCAADMTCRPVGSSCP